MAEATTCAVCEEVDPVPAVVAGFIVWLAEQRFETNYRHRCPAVA